MKVDPDVNIRWKKSSKCQIGECTEVAEVGGHILVRNSQRKSSVARFSVEEWTAFIEGVKSGEFDIS